MAEPVHVVWFKRDLRAHDHEPLAEAAAMGPVLPLYIVEPGLWAEPDVAARHWAFTRECLGELRCRLAELGQPLVVRVGDVVAVLETIRARRGIVALWSHEETGSGWTFARDRRVAGWARGHGIAWHERPQTGVIRRLRDRYGWAAKWNRSMAQPTVPAPSGLRPLYGIDPGLIPSAAELGLAADPCPDRQAGGRNAGLNVLDSFLHRRGEPYQRAMSSPETGARHCSRLSPHLALGTVSMREAFQAATVRLDALRALPQMESGRWPGALNSFIGRLHWHCHFMQKLEDEPAIEHAPFHPAFAGLRDNDATRLAAWASGHTGWPFVDACMRSLQATGWLNFRMRAMLMSVAAYQLWLDWRPAGLVLARTFTDYEPGIHWPQCQMQAGTTGINTPRIYDPIKQGRDHDPDGRFIRRWVPELARVPSAWLHTPWTMPSVEQRESGCRLDIGYPRPPVDHVAAARLAKERLWAVRRDPCFGATADAVQAKHGSRKAGVPRPDQRRPKAAKKAPASRRQLSLDL